MKKTSGFTARDYSEVAKECVAPSELFKIGMIPRRPDAFLTGFSLIEMIVVISVVGALAAIAAIPLSMGARAYVTGKELLRVHEMGRAAIWRIERELRDLDKGQVTTAGAASLAFKDAYQENITFSLAGAQLRRNGAAMADSVSALIFTYYDRANNVLGPLPLDAANRANVYCISVDFSISSGAESYSFRTTIFPRDLRY